MAVVLAIAVIGWRAAQPHDASLGRAALPRIAPPAAAGDRLIVEPDAGMRPIDELLGSARRTLDLTMYELDDPAVESVLADDAARGVAVRVLLDYRLEAAHNQPAYDYLRARGIAVRWSSPRFFATHEKAFVIDGRTAVVMSLNLASRYYATSRDVAVVDTDPRDAAAIEDVFTLDFAGRDGGTPAADDLVWSPRQSAADLVALVERARQSVLVESEELSSEPVVRALVDAARRGLAVRLVMTDQVKWRPAFARLTQAGASVGVMYGERPLYIHAKLLVVDSGTAGGIAFVGSENLSDASLLHDRELGLVLLSPVLVSRLAAVVGSDLSAARTYR
jgi:phosphatidylserine/phosphatidylglycerophosphate/cardiolipin synthase-like enzyme